jgi:hypothetical protein
VGVLKLSLIAALVTTSLFGAKINYYPIKGVFVSDKAKGAMGGILGWDANKSTSFSEWQKSAVGMFDTSFRQKFSSVESLENHKNVSEIITAYIKITRFSEYQVPKSESRMDYYFPLTASVSFVNTATGEVLYTNQFTDYMVYEGMKSDMGSVAFAQEKEKIFKNSFANLSENLLKGAAEKFKPSEIGTKVVKEVGGLLVLDKGSDAGMAVGEQLAQNKSRVTVVHVDRNYSVAKPLLKSLIPMGTVFQKFVTEGGDASSIKKPKVALYIDTELNVGYKDQMKQFFTDKIAQAGTFNVIPIDKMFTTIYNNTIKSTISVAQQQEVEKRQAPDYAVRLSINGQYFVKEPSDKDWASFDNYGALVCGDWVDMKSSKVVYSTCKYETIRDEVVGNIRFENSARQEIVLKNAVQAIAEDFAQKIKFTPTVVNVQEVEGKLAVLENKQGIVENSDNLEGYKNIGHIDGIEGDVRIPVGTLSVRLDGKSSIIKNLKKQATFSLEKGDTAYSQKVDFPKEAKLLILSEPIVVGDYTLDNVRNLALSVASAMSSYPVFGDQSFADKNIELMSLDGFDVDEKEIKSIDSNYFLVPRYGITTISEKCEDTGICEGSYSVSAGVRVYNGALADENIVFKTALKENRTIFYPKEYKKDKLDGEFLGMIRSLLEQTAEKIKL